jgi:hypothetical protein
MTITGPDGSQLDEIGALVHRIQELIGELADAINKKIGELLSIVGHWIQVGWDRFMAAMKQVWDFWNEVAQNMGAPWTLDSMADAWTEQVGQVVSGKVGIADLNPLAVDDYWTGQAANRYKQLIPQQHAALDNIKKVLTDGIAAALQKVSTAIVIFWVALAGALAALVAGIISAIIAAASVAGAPAAPFIAAGAALIAVAAIGGGMFNLVQACSSANTDLLAKKDDLSAWPDGQWPPATVY